MGREKAKARGNYYKCLKKPALYPGGRCHGCTEKDCVPKRKGLIVP
jgi:hypothetical protein